MTRQETCLSTAGTMQISAAAYTPVDTHAPIETGRFHWIMGAMLAAMVAIGAALEPSLALKHYRLFGCLVPSVAVVFCLRWLGYQRAADLMTSLAYICGSWVAMVPLLAAAAHNSAPLCDATLARLDLIRTATFVHWMRAHPALNIASVLVYASMFPLVGLTGLAPLLGYRAAARRFVLAGTIALLVTVAGFSVLPAAGPWSDGSYRPTIDQNAVDQALHAMKAHAIDFPQDAGIVSFPSFHTILAILSAFALWPIRWLRWPAAILALAICASTVTTGWHYGVDVIAGAVLALFAQWVAARVMPEPQPLRPNPRRT